MENTSLIITKKNAYKIQTALKPQSLRSYKKALSLSDKGLLQKAVKHWRSQSKNYEDSWGYVIQATRYGGFRWYDPKNRALIFFGRKSESDTRLVVPVYFAEPRYLTQVIATLQEELETSQTVLKNVNFEETETLLNYGFRPYAKNESWDSLTPFDDQTFPQLLVKLENLANPAGGHYKKLRTTLNKNPELTLRKYSSDDKDKILALFALKDGNIKEDADRTKGMYYTSHAMYTTADIEKFVILDKTIGEIIGFTATSDISPKITAFVSSIFKPGVKVASVWGIYHTLLSKYLDK